MLFDQGKLEKMTIRAFLPTTSKDDPPQVSDAPEDTYVVQVNPNKYKLDHQLAYAYQQGQGFSVKDPAYSHSQPITMQFEFLFDGTGVVPPPSELGDIPLVGAIASALSGRRDYKVMEEIGKFNRLVYKVDGNEHRPRKVLLVWGALVFPCILASVNYRFTLFKPDGTPLRAVASCSFREYQTCAEQAKKNNLRSPDLTHRREVKEGDTLPLMAHRIYGDAGLYLEVARANNLVNFRRLQPGSRVVFPPIDKQSKP